MSSKDNYRYDGEDEERLKAWMLGPEAENGDVFREMFLKAFQDYRYWRQNFHPEDVSIVSASDRMSEPFQQFQESLRDHLFEMLSHLKKSVPFFSPRYIGHMNTDLLMSSMLGYVSAMFYNQNNVVEEASTMTARFEREAMQMIRDMIGYGEEAWGHFASGGTVSNIEALWTARNLRLFPYQVALTVAEADARIERELLQLPVSDDHESFADFYKEDRLQALTIEEILRLKREVEFLCGKDQEMAELVDEKSLQELGVNAFLRKCRAKDVFTVPERFRIVVSKNVHYSLQKAVGLIGFGERDLIEVPLNEEIRLDVDVMKEKVKEVIGEGQSILAVVGVYGSTEEGSIDDFKEIVDFRESMRQKGHDFWIHADACYGGYALSMLRPDEPKGGDLAGWTRRMAREGKQETDVEPPSVVSWSEEKADEWIARSKAVSECDSVTIDPHKLGYVPYPAGVILHKDGRTRQFIEHDAPYLNVAESGNGDQDGEDSLSALWDTENLGKFTLEGSRPGASSAAAWLAHKTVPLDRSGHGQIVARSILGARYLKHTLADLGDESPTEDGLRCKFLTERPDLNILAYTLPVQIDGYEAPLAVLNRSLDRLYSKLLPTEENQVQKQDFVVAKTSMEGEEYGQEMLNGLLEEWGIPGRVREDLGDEANPWKDDEKVSFIRSVIMGPFLYEASTRPQMEEENASIIDQYISFLEDNFPSIAQEVMSKPLPRNQQLELNNPILILEDDRKTSEQLRSRIEKSFRVPAARGLITQAKNLEEGKRETRKSTLLSAALVDLELEGNRRGGIEYLKFAKPHLDGAIVLSGTVAPGMRDEIEELSSEDFKVNIHEKDKLDEFSVVSYRAFADLWDIIS